MSPMPGAGPELDAYIQVGLQKSCWTKGS